MKELSREIDRLIETSDSSVVDVIVSMSGQGDRLSPFVEIAAAALRNRAVMTSARDVLPATMADIARVHDGKGKSAASARRRISDHEASFASQMALNRQSAEIAGTDARSAQKTLMPLLKSQVVRNRFSKLPAKSKDGQPTELWIADSVALRLHKDDLSRLPREVPEVSAVYRNRRLSLPGYSEVANVPARVQERSSASWGIEQIGAASVWGIEGARGKGVKVAVLDTGVDAAHPDLKGKIAAWAEFDRRGSQVRGSKPHDTDEHGTHVCGTIVGGRASGRCIGVAPEAEVLAALVLDGKKGGTDAQVLAGMQWAIEQQADIISLSLGGLTLDADVPDVYTNVIVEALRRGIAVVAAVGNEGGQTTGSPGNDLFALGVGASDSKDRVAGFSGGRTHIIRSSDVIDANNLPITYQKPDVIAPGVAVYSSTPGGRWKWFNGTSMATPHVAGAMALLLSGSRIKTHIRQEQRGFLLKDLICGSVEELGEAGQDQRYGFGRIDVLRAFGCASERGYL